MSALIKRLNRGIDAIKHGDRDTAENLLDEVSTLPGSREPISGLLGQTEERFYELRALLSGPGERDDDAAAASWSGDRDAEDDWDLEDEGDAWDDDDDDVVADEQITADDGDDEVVALERYTPCGCSSDQVMTVRDDDPAGRLALSMEYEFDGNIVEVERHEESFREVAIDARETRDTLVTVQSYNSSISLTPDAAIPDAVAQNLMHDLDPDRAWSECHVEELRVLRTTLVYKDEGLPPLRG